MSGRKGPFRPQAWVQPWQTRADILLMNHAAAIASVSAHVQLGGHVLRALEHRELPLHARDYQETALCAHEELQALGPEQLDALRWRLPAALGEVVENVLHEKGCARWCADSAQPLAEQVWAALQPRLRQGCK